MARCWDVDSTVAQSITLGPASGLLVSWSPCAPFRAAVALMCLGYYRTTVLHPTRLAYELEA
jgi:hypothetical protein